MGSVQMALAGIFGIILGGFYDGMAYGFGNFLVWIFRVGDRVCHDSARRV